MHSSKKQILINGHAYSAKKLALNDYPLELVVAQWPATVQVQRSVLRKLSTNLSAILSATEIENISKKSNFRSSKKTTITNKDISKTITDTSFVTLGSIYPLY